jgi:hypothetical protein
MAMRMGMIAAALALIGALPGPAGAQSFTTAAEVRPILEATRGAWIALRPWDGQELLYFTHLESWRCGLSQIRYAINGGAEQVWETDPCLAGTAQPNAIAADRAPYTRLPADLVQSVTVVLVLDDGTEMRQSFDRAAILMP